MSSPLRRGLIKVENFYTPLRGPISDRPETKSAEYFDDQLFPTGLLKTLESGKSLQKTTIPYKFVEFVDEATDNNPDEFCRKAADGNLADIQGAVDQFITTLSEEKQGRLLEKVGPGLTAAIRTFANWHYHCMLWTADFQSHRESVVYALAEKQCSYDPDLPFSVALRWYNNYYSMMLSLATARGHIEAFPPTRRQTSLSARNEPKKIDAYRACVIFHHVEIFISPKSVFPLSGRVLSPPENANDIYDQARLLRSDEWLRYSDSRKYKDVKSALSEDEQTKIAHIRIFHDAMEKLTSDEKDFNIKAAEALGLDKANEVLFNSRLPDLSGGGGGDSATFAPFSKVVIEEEPKADDGGDDDGELAAAHDWSAGP